MNNIKTNQTLKINLILSRNSYSIKLYNLLNFSVENRNLVQPCSLFLRFLRKILVKQYSEQKYSGTCCTWKGNKINQNSVNYILKKQIKTQLVVIYDDVRFNTIYTS